MISVIIPLYNKEKSITRTLESVLAQTCTDFECVIVNDGSTDQSAQVVRDWLEDRGLRTEDRGLRNEEGGLRNEDKGCHFRLINKENGGVSSARNRGIEEAKGEYVAFLDGDDLWHPTYLEELEKMIADYPDKGLYAMGYKEIRIEDGGLRIEEGGVRTEEGGVRNEEGGVRIEDGGMRNEEGGVRIEDGEWVRGEIENPWSGKLRIWTGSSSSSRALILELGGFDTRMTHGEDIDMWWRLLLAKGGAQYTKPLAYYVQDSENRAMQKTTNGLFPLEKHIPYYIEKYQEARNENAAFRKYFDTEMIYRLYPYLFDKRYRKEAKRLAELLDYSQLKRSMKFRMEWPWVYRLYRRMKE